MNTFDPGDIVCLKDKVSPEMMVIGESDGMVTAFWQDAFGVAATGDYPTNWLKPISAEASHLPAAILKVSDLLKSKDEGLGSQGRVG